MSRVIPADVQAAIDTVRAALSHHHGSVGLNEARPGCPDCAVLDALALVRQHIADIERERDTFRERCRTLSDYVRDEFVEWAEEAAERARVEERAEAAERRVAALENVIERASNMRNAAIPVEVHGVARIAVEQFDEARALLAGSPDAREPICPGCGRAVDGTETCGNPVCAPAEKDTLPSDPEEQRGRVCRRDTVAEFRDATLCTCLVPLSENCAADRLPFLPPVLPPDGTDAA